LLGPLVNGSPRNCLVMIDAAHEVQLQKTEELAENILSFTKSMA